MVVTKLDPTQILLDFTQILLKLLDIRDLIDDVSTELAQIEAKNVPIPNAYIRVPSFTREGVDHVVRVVDGVVNCGCEAATFNPESGECKHIRAVRAMGQIDGRAVFAGGN